MKRILIVEDESSISDFVKGELEYEGYEVCIKEDGREGLEEALNNEYDLVNRLIQKDSIPCYHGSIRYLI